MHITGQVFTRCTASCVSAAACLTGEGKWASLKKTLLWLNNGQIIELTSESMQLDGKIHKPLLLCGGSSVGDIERGSDARSVHWTGGVVWSTGCLTACQAACSRRRNPYQGIYRVRKTRKHHRTGAQAIAEVVPYSNGSVTQDVERRRGRALRETHRKPTVFVTVSKV
jgi:hypothetical protein